MLQYCKYSIAAVLTPKVWMIMQQGEREEQVVKINVVVEGTGKN